MVGFGTEGADMSTFSQFVGGGGGATIKAIQRGTISLSMTPGVFTTTATISAVDPTKTELRFLGGSGYDSSASVSLVPRIVLTDSTTISVTSALTPGYAMAISWELTEYN